MVSDLHERGFVGLAAPWIAIALGVALEAFCLLAGVASIFILVHWVVNPLLYVAACIVSVIAYRPWRANRSTAFVVAGILLCALLVLHSITGRVWPYAYIKPYW
jgi:hypothetical protein